MMDCPRCHVKCESRIIRACEICRRGEMYDYVCPECEEEWGCGCTGTGCVGANKYA